MTDQSEQSTEINDQSLYQMEENISMSLDPSTDGALKEQDRYLPIANVARIMKNAIPEGGKISREAKECCQECVSEFISFITSEASDRCSQEKRKTINGEDILYAMSILGFDNYVSPLKAYLQKYRDSSKERVPSVPEEMDDVNAPLFNTQIQLSNHPSAHALGHTIQSGSGEIQFVAIDQE